MMTLRKKCVIKILKPDGGSQPEAKENRRPANSELAIKKTVESWIREWKRNSRLAEKNLRIRIPPHSPVAS